LRSKEIHTKYFSSNAVCELNLDSNILDRIHRELADRNLSLSDTQQIFDEAAQACYQLMRDSSFPRFKKHIICKKLVERFEKEEIRKRAVESLNLGIE